MTIWFTSDQHFGHAKILKSCDRPFVNVEEMDETIIKNYNELVGPDDTVFFLGDLSWYSGRITKTIVSRLTGNKHLIIGNHDGKAPRAYQRMGFSSVHTMFVLSACSWWPDVKDTWFLSHEPVEQLVAEGMPMMCGHIHNLALQFCNAINVGVDVWGFSPMSLETIREMYNE